jgi:hypothetical protein
VERREVPPGKASASSKSRQFKEELWCVLNQRNGNVRLVQRPRKSSLMPGMWELPPLPQQLHRTTVTVPWRTFRHSITVTNFTVHVHRGPAAVAKGKWVPVASISHLPITGLTRKILKAADII